LTEPYFSSATIEIARLDNDGLKRCSASPDQKLKTFFILHCFFALNVGAQVLPKCTFVIVFTIAIAFLWIQSCSWLFKSRKMLRKCQPLSADCREANGQAGRLGGGGGQFTNVKQLFRQCVDACVTKLLIK
jgi:hypothetical protein